MPAVRNYQTLVTEAGRFFGRADLAQAAGTHTPLAEQDLARRVPTPEQDTTVDLTFDTDGTAPVPADYRSPIALKVSGGAPLAALTEAVRASQPNAQGYWIEGPIFRLAQFNTEAPTPATLRYIASMEPLTVAQPVNTWLRAYPLAYLYGLCRIMALHTPDLADSYEKANAAYENEIAAIERDVRARMWKNIRVVRKGPRP